jgi:hypothetical protein
MPDELKEQQSLPTPRPNLTVTQAGPYGSHYFSPAYFGDYFGNRMSPENPPRVKVTLDLSPEAARALDELIGQTGDTPSDLFRKALGLYALAEEAKREGKAVGIAATPDSLETEFVGL